MIRIEAQSKYYFKHDYAQTEELEALCIDSLFKDLKELLQKWLLLEEGLKLVTPS